MNVGIKISGISSSLAADAVVRLRDDVQRESDLWLSQRRRVRSRPAPQADDGSDQPPQQRRR